MFEVGHDLAPLLLDLMIKSYSIDELKAPVEVNWRVDYATDFKHLIDANLRRRSNYQVQQVRLHVEELLRFFLADASEILVQDGWLLMRLYGLYKLLPVWVNWRLALDN